MKPETEEIIKEQMKILPPEVINILADPALGDKILNIGRKNGLTEEQLEIFHLETNLVLLGLVHPDEYSDELKNRLKVNDVKVDNIINEVNREILSGVRKKLTDMFNVNDESLTDERMETAPEWMQNLDFVLSGGDYSTFTENINNETAASKDENKAKISGYTTDTPPKMMNMKNKFLYDNDKNQ